MKKIACAMLIASGVGASFSAMAAGVAIDTSTPISQTACVLLSEPVQVNLSRNVVGAYKCDEITTTISVAACHVAGSRKAKTVACTGRDTDADGVNDTFDPVGCSASTPTIEIADYTAFGGTSKGGALGTHLLGGNCTQSSVNGIALFN